MESSKAHNIEQHNKDLVIDAWAFLEGEVVRVEGGH